MVDFGLQPRPDAAGRRQGVKSCSHRRSSGRRPNQRKTLVDDLFYGSRRSHWYLVYGLACCLAHEKSVSGIGPFTPPLALTRPAHQESQQPGPAPGRLEARARGAKRKGRAVRSIPTASRLVRAGSCYDASAPSPTSRANAPTSATTVKTTRLTSAALRAPTGGGAPRSSTGPAASTCAAKARRRRGRRRRRRARRRRRRGRCERSGRPQSRRLDSTTRQRRRRWRRRHALAGRACASRKT